jgi:Hydrazine synthase alpha subunit middle domain
VRVGAIAAFTLALVACVFWIKVAAQPPSQQLSVPIVYTSAPRYESQAWLHGGERFPSGATVILKQRESSHALVTGFSATADPSVSFDGTRIIFSGKRDAKSQWQVWEARVDGGDLRQVTSCSTDCVRPFYLPGERVVYARKVNNRFALETAPLTGGTALPLTYTPGSALPTDVLRDGRILFEAGFPFARRSSSEIYTVYSDGSGVESYRCDHGNNRQVGKQVSSGDIVFSQQTGLARFSSAVAHQLELNAPAGEFAGDVVQTSTGDYLLSWRPDAKSQYSLRLWNPRTGGFQSVVADASANAVQASLIAPRPIPNLHPSGLHDWNYANLLCLNAYTSKYRFAEGSIASIRLYAANQSGKPTLLGSSHVESDGSFYLRVPADQPLQIELLDGSGKTLKREQGWFWMRKGEQRICVGCHAGPERAPENKVPAVLVKTTIPIDLTRPNAKPLPGGR